MGLFGALLKKKQKTDVILTEEGNTILKMTSFFDTLLSENKYIARSDYSCAIEDYKDTVNTLKTLVNAGLLKEYSEKNGLSLAQTKQAYKTYTSITELVKKHNDDFISKNLVDEKTYLDNILKDVDPDICLDENQRKVVLDDEDFSLVIAGAGAGKTTTVAAKAKYLVEKKGVQDNEILIVSFTNKAVGELRDKINKDLGLNCIISTFHSIGNAILKLQNDEMINIVTEDRLFFLLQDYFKEKVISNQSLLHKIVLFFASYLKSPENEELETFLASLAKSNNTSLKFDFEENKIDVFNKRTGKMESIQNEIMRSYQEVQIANFLYMNSLEYDYEPVYKYNIKLANKPYTPDFCIKQGDNCVYLEHFGINEDGTSGRYDQKTLDKYKKAINDKILLHREHGTKLIYTFSGYNDKRDFLIHLKEELIKCGFILKKKNDAEILEKFNQNESNKYLGRLISLICRFINNFKTNGYTVDNFQVMYDSTSNVRDRLFLDICKECFLEYEQYLESNNAIDFQDMINNSAKILLDMKKSDHKLGFKYVIVDEYQDISKQRFDLVNALHEVCDAKIMAVGDDWQSIYAFSGSDIKLFTDFEQKVGYASMQKIIMTYRNSQEIIDIAGNFIQKNTSQITKNLKSPKHIKDPIIIYTYDSTLKRKGDNNKTGASYQLSLAVQKALDDIHRYEISDGKKSKDILLLGRFNFDRNHLENSGLFEINEKNSFVKSVKYPKDRITYMTAHASKGLGYDNVIIINGMNDTFGFPSKIENDPVLRFVVKEDQSYSYAEERRLFYVAMTRTKNRVYCVAPEAYPSEFLLEIKKCYENVVLKGQWDENPKIKTTAKKCPICGYPLVYRPNRKGLRLYICKNEPEVCGFMTNDLSGGKMQIMKCDCCQDGYLIVKKRKEGEPFLGCTNFRRDGKGCNNTLSKDKYYSLLGLTPEIVVEKKKVDKTSKDMSVKQNEKKTISRADNSYRADLFDDCFTILSCVNTVSQKKHYGVSKYVEILKGKAKSKNTDVKFEELNEYGSMISKSHIDIENMILWLVEKGYLYRTISKYPVLHPTSKTNNFGNIVSKKEMEELNVFLRKKKNESTN